MAGFKAPCPSCDHGVPVSDVKLVGTKIECPKCKYRFKVEAPKDMPAAEAKTKGKDKSKDKEKAKDKSKTPAEPAKDKGNSGKKKPDRKMIIGIGLGVVAVALLVGGGMMMFGGSDDDVSKPLPPPRPKQPQTIAKTNDSGDKPKDKEKTNPTVDPTPKVVLVPSDKNATNLLPGESRAVVRVDLDRVRETPLYKIVVNDAVTEVLRNALGLDPGKVEFYYHAYVDSARLPFGVVRLKEPIAEKEALAASAGPKGARSPIQGREYYSLQANASQQAVGKLLTVEALLGMRRTPPPDAPPAARPLAVCAYDTQTILLADQAALEAFLTSLQPSGYPAFKTEFVKGTAPAPKTSNGKRDLSANPDYCTLDPELKVILNSMEDQENPTILTMAARLDATDRDLDPSLYPGDARPWAAAASTALTNASIVGLTVRSFTSRDAAFQLVVESSSGDETRSLKERLGPMISTAATGLGPVLGHQVALEGFGELAVPMTTTPEGLPVPPPAAVPVAPSAGLETGPSKLSMSVADRTINITGSFAFSPKVYSNIVWQRMRLLGNQFQGQVLVISGTAGRRMLAPAVSQMTAKGDFPPGASMDRTTGVDRYGLRYPPSTRVSFFHNLLPYLGKGIAAGSIDPKLAWYDTRNLEGAESWVPEFLVPSFPATSWRAMSPYAEGRSLGATNIVGVAGLGRDAARYSPTNPADAKRMGMVGYDWGSKLSDVTDGTANTIYLIQVPPTYSRPWIAGGGATVTGVDDTLPNPAAAFATQRDGKRGTYALMADGSVRWIGENIDRNVFLGMTTRAGGENLGDLDKASPKDAPNVGELKTTDARK